MRWEYQILPSSDLDSDVLNKMGSEGWDLVLLVKQDLVFKRSLSGGGGGPVGLVKVCGNCTEFDVNKSDSSTGRCSKYGAVMNEYGHCDDGWIHKAVTKKDTPADKPSDVPAIATEEVSPWHLRANTLAGERRLDAMTDLSEDPTGQPASHRHRVVAVVTGENKVVKGMTDMVEGHVHEVKYIGMLEEKAGHAHTWKAAQLRQ